tara:strand:+ start:344 stop:658 length:315 start_codon:yes stop_codon:yes gene_type:complete
MKKTVLSLILIGLLVVPVVGFAQRTAPVVPIDRLLDNIVNWLFTILLVVATIWLIIAGYYFVTAQGDPDRVAKARNMVLWALIGVLVAFAAKGLVLLIEKIART